MKPSPDSMSDQANVLNPSTMMSSEKNIRFSLKKKLRISETIIQGLLFVCGALSIITTLAIVYELGVQALPFFTNTQWESTMKPLVRTIATADTRLEVGTSGRDPLPGDLIRLDDEIMRVLSVESDTVLIVERGAEGSEPKYHEKGHEFTYAIRVTLDKFFTQTEWSPHTGKFGIWALANATIITSLIALLVAVPLGLSVAIYLSEYASQRARDMLKPTLEVLAGVPTVVYGYFALTFMTPILRSIFGKDVVEIYNMASAGIVVGILILPLIASMSEDALSAVPRALREASYGLGATKLETVVRVVVPAALSGITAALIIAFSRAVGETMIVALASGAGPNFTFNPFKAAETMAGHIVRISGGDLSYNSIDYNSLFAIGLMLFFMTLILNIFSQWVVNRFREEYE